MNEGYFLALFLKDVCSAATAVLYIKQNECLCAFGWEAQLLMGKNINIWGPDKAIQQRAVNALQCQKTGWKCHFSLGVIIVFAIETECSRLSGNGQEQNRPEKMEKVCKMIVMACWAVALWIRARVLVVAVKNVIGIL